MSTELTRQSKGCTLLRVRVQPRASKKGVEGVSAGLLRVRLTAPPADGEANAQLIDVLSDALGVRKSAIRVVQGHSSRQKTVELDIDETALRQRLMPFMEE